MDYRCLDFLGIASLGVGLAAGERLKTTKSRWQSETERKTMITSKMTRAEVEAILDDGGNFLKAQVDLPVFAENFFEYGFQNNHKRFFEQS